MTPAIKLLHSHKIDHTIHEYRHDPKAQSFGEEAARRLDVSDQRVFKTLVVETAKSDLIVGIVPVSTKLNLKAIANAVDSKKVVIADKNKVERVTGYVLGGVSPLGQKKTLTTIIDFSALNFKTIFVSAGRRGLEIELNPQELCTLSNGRFADIID